MNPLIALSYRLRSVVSSSALRLVHVLVINSQNLALARYSVWRIRVYFTDIILVRVAARRSRRSRSCGARPGGVPTGAPVARSRFLCVCVCRDTQCCQYAPCCVRQPRLAARAQPFLTISSVFIGKPHYCTMRHSLALCTGTTSHLCCY